jgi:hypothetical protein
VILPDAGTGKEPLHVSFCPATDGSDVVAPDVLPATYENPAGRVSLMLVSAMLASFGLLTLIV